MMLRTLKVWYDLICVKSAGTIHTNQPKMLPILTYSHSLLKPLNAIQS